MITSVTLKNFKCFRDQTFQFAPLTILSGMNGLGKSSVIQSLLLVRQSLMDNLDANRLVLNGEFVRLGRLRDVLCWDAKDDSFLIEILFANGHELIVQESSQNESMTSPLDSEIYEANITYEKNGNNAPQLLSNNNFSFLSAERLGPRTSLPSSKHYVTSHKDVGMLGEYTGQFLSEFGDKQIIDKRLKHESCKLESLKSQLEAWMSEITPFLRIHAEEMTKIDSVQLRYSFFHDVESERFRSTNVGFGISYVLPVVAALLAPFENRLIMIENPEAHLHPAGQSAIGRLIALAASVGHQVIVETHSDHIINGIRVAVKKSLLYAKDVSTLHFVPEKTSIQPRLQSPILDHNGRYDDWPDGFFDQLDKSLEELI